MKLSILCVTSKNERAYPFYDHFKEVAAVLGAECVIVNGAGAGYIESVLDTALDLTTGDYVLRLDDDEKCSPAMIEWLKTKEYEHDDHWCFARVHLWENPGQMLVSQEFYPDWQTRLSVRAKSGGRTKIHAMSPFGRGRGAPAVLEHWNFLVKSAEEQEKTTRYYHQMLGYGANYVRPSRKVVVGTYVGGGALPILGQRVCEVEIG